MKLIRFNHPPLRTLGRGFLLAALLLLSAGCAPKTASAPTPLVFDAPTAQIDTFTRFFREGCHFGGAVAIASDIVVTSAPCWRIPPGEGTGTVYVLRRSTAGDLQMETALSASDQDDGFQYDQVFGESVGFDGRVIAVGVPGADDPKIGDNTGAVYLFEHGDGGWTETGKLNPAGRKPGARFGSSLAFEGNLLAVSGAPGAGEVTLFERGNGGWQETAQVPVPSLPGGEPGYVLLDLFGDTLAISVISMPPLNEQEQPNEQAFLQSLRRTGLVTLFERSGAEWKQTFQTTPQEASLYRMYDGPYGIPVALGGEAGKATWLAVGKPGFSGSGRELGTVAIFERKGRGWEARVELSLTPGTPVPGGLPFFGPDPGPIFFGAAVEVEGNRLAVISTFANTVYVFERRDGDWSYLYRLTPGAEIGDDFMRRTVAMSGSTVLLGSPGELGGGDVLLFDLPQ